MGVIANVQGIVIVNSHLSYACDTSGVNTHTWVS